MAACGSDTSEAEPNTHLLFWDTGILTKALDDGSPDQDQSFLHKAAKIFEEENPGKTIEIYRQDSSDISVNQAQFQAAMTAGNGPDVRSQYAGGPTLSYSEYFADLTPLLADQIEDMSGWITVREGYDPDGRIVGMPYGAGLYFVVFTNNKILRSAGLDPSDPPKTWEQMMDNGRQVAAKTDHDPFWVADLEGYVGAWVVGGLIGGELGETASTAMYNGELPLDNPAMLKAYQAWAGLGSSGLTNPDAATISNDEGGKGFLQGNSAYFINGSWHDQVMEEGLGDDVGWFFLPMLDGAEYPSTAAGGPSVAISMVEDTPNRELAEEFIKFLARPDIQDLYVETVQMESSNNKLGDPTVITNRLLREQAEALTSIETVVFPFDSVMQQSVIDVFYRVNAAVFLGSVTPEDAVAQLQDAQDAELAGD
jgi:ABC-type glycerol-3-phosphate transport system substrate-binding protein